MIFRKNGICQVLVTTTKGNTSAAKNMRRTLLLDILERSATLTNKLDKTLEFLLQTKFFLLCNARVNVLHRGGGVGFICVASQTRTMRHILVGTTAS